MLYCALLPLKHQNLEKKFDPLMEKPLLTIIIKIELDLFAGKTKESEQSAEHSSRFFEAADLDRKQLALLRSLSSHKRESRTLASFCLIKSAARLTKNCL